MGILTVLEGHVQEKRRQNVMRSRMSAFILMGMRWSWENYEKIVVDFGALGEQKKAELLRCQKVYLVISFSEWQEGAFGNQNDWEQEAVTYGWHCLAAFGSEESRNKWNQVRHPAVDRIPLSADAFSIVPEQIQWLDQLR